MKEKPYHHGNLQTKLIEEGLMLIHEEGLGNFSLRKLAKRLEVSPTACYNHYPTAQNLLDEIKNYVTKRFSDALQKGVNDSEPEFVTISLGKAYVNFFADNPHYFSFIYDNGDYKIELTANEFDGDFEPFCIFKETAIKYMKSHNISEEKHLDNLIVMWAAVHGLAAMANMKGFHYNGDWEVLTEKILSAKINLQ